MIIDSEQDQRTGSQGWILQEMFMKVVQCVLGLVVKVSKVKHGNFFFVLVV
jgi:hypothetical protein